MKTSNLDAVKSMQTSINVSIESTEVAVIGLGYVGLPLSQVISKAGIKVTGYDLNQERNTLLNEGISYMLHVENKTVMDMLAMGFRAKNTFADVARASAIIICVPTPLTKNREPDLSSVIAAVKSILPYLKTGQIISLESTTWPGTTEEVIAPLIENAGFIIGEDIYLVYSPEREDPGNSLYSTQNIPKLIGGLTKRCVEKGEALYRQFIHTVVPVSHCKVAEMAKLIENTQRAVNISLVNELKLICNHMGIDIFEVIDAAGTKPFGFTKYFPGPGIGGHCIPVDPHYLGWKAKEFELNLDFIEIAENINFFMPKYVCEKIIEALNFKKKALNCSKILILGLAYKRDVDDVRESPSLKIIDRLTSMGALVEYSDPFFPKFIHRTTDEKLMKLNSVKITPENLREYDITVLLTNHSGFDYSVILEHSNMIVDTRGMYSIEPGKIWRA